MKHTTTFNPDSINDPLLSGAKVLDFNGLKKDKTQPQFKKDRIAVMNQLVGNKKEVILLAHNDVFFVGQVTDYDYTAPIIKLEKPLLVKMNPVNNENSKAIDTIVVTLVIPIEFAGIQIYGNLYTGFLSTTLVDEDQTDLLNSTDNLEVVIDKKTEEKLIIRRMNSLADINTPSIIFPECKVLKPAKQLEELYLTTAANYDKMLRHTRLVNIQHFVSEVEPQPESPMKTDSFTPSFH